MSGFYVSDNETLSLGVYNERFHQNPARMRDEISLIKAGIKQNRAAQQKLYELYSPKMLGVCYRYASSKEEAEDMLQEGFIRVFQKMDTFRFQGSFEGWLRRIIVNTAINIIRKYQNLKYECDIDSAAYIPAASGDAIASMYTREVIELVRDLPNGYRTVLNLYAIEGYSHKEIADMLGINESSSRSQYTRAKALLAKRLEQIESFGIREHVKVSHP
ncbi:MAG: RNA polymerase sigma factor [Bacteroidota bacterium]|nr:RNA polymerase sigma factor [Bacteroidota bacterium]MDX5431180.1 RNA polymerase sigma factor [Bacteroidota bacterium]MDX5469919.1 RNA polymerase sigma factor [Bacteroidota bacterium]